MKKKRNSQMGLWVGLLIFAGIAMAMSLRDLGFFRRSEVTTVAEADPHGHSHEEKPDTRPDEQKKAQMAAAAEELKKSSKRPIELDPGATAPPPPRKPKPGANQTGSQWYREDSAAKAGSKP